MHEDYKHAERYRHRAIEVRLIAEGMRDRNTRRILDGVADDWDRMARTMDAIAASDLTRAALSRVNIEISKFRKVT